MSKEATTYNDEEISLREVLLKLGEWLRYLLRQWKWILLFAVIGGLIGWTHSFFQKTYYTATLSFVTENGKTGGSNIGNYSSLAAQFGINLGTSNLSGGLFEGSNIFDLMRSHRMIMETLLTPIIINDTSTLLIDRYIKMQKLRDEWKDNPQLKNISFDIDTSRFTINHYAVMKNISAQIVKKNLSFSRGAFYTVSCHSTDEIFSKLFVEKLIDNVSAFYKETKTQKARENLDIIQQQLDSVRNQLYLAMDNVASFQDINQNLVRQAPKVQQQKGSLKVQINSNIYQQLVSSLEAAKVELRKETPLFEVVDAPILPLDKKRPSNTKWIVFGIFLGAFITAAWLLVRKVYKEIMNVEKQETE